MKIEPTTEGLDFNRQQLEREVDTGRDLDDCQVTDVIALCAEMEPVVQLPITISSMTTALNGASEKLYGEPGHWTTKVVTRAFSKGYIAIDE